MQLCSFIHAAHRSFLRHYSISQEKMASYNVNNVSRYITEIVRSNLTEHNYLNSA